MEKVTESLSTKVENIAMPSVDSGSIVSKMSSFDFALKHIFASNTK